LSLETIVAKTAHNPAVLFSIVDRGFVREGYFADLVAVDLSGTTEIQPARLRYQCGWSPLDGTVLHSRIALTIVNGVIVVRDGEPIGPRAARALEFRKT
jgi:dihydroorotase